MNAGAAIGNASWLAASLPEYRRFRRDAGNLERVQRNRLAHYLKQNAQTAFGIEHDFASLRSWEAFSQRVPARNYDEFAAWVSRIASGEARVLTNDPVRMFEPSSGSSGPAKWIPYTRTMQREIRRAVAVWSAQTFLSQPELLAGRAYWSLTPQISTNPAPTESIAECGRHAITATNTSA